MKTDKVFCTQLIILLSIVGGLLYVIIQPTETIKYKDVPSSKDVGIYLYEAGVRRGVYEALEEIIEYGAEDFDTKRVIY